jgi:hypothetical protein
MVRGEDSLKDLGTSAHLASSNNKHKRFCMEKIIVIKNAVKKTCGNNGPRVEVPLSGNGPIRRGPKGIADE